MNWLNGLVTEANNRIPDLKRITALVLLIGFQAGQIDDTFFQHHAFDAKAYGVGAGLLVAALGAALGMGAKAETPVIA